MNDDFDNALHEMMASNYNVLEYGSSEIEPNQDASDNEFNALVDMLTMELVLTVISSLKLPDLAERLYKASHELMGLQSKEMQSDPFNKQLIESVVDRILDMKDTKE